MNSSIGHCHLETSDGAFFWQYCIEMRASMTALEKVGSNPITATTETGRIEYREVQRRIPEHVEKLLIFVL